MFKNLHKNLFSLFTKKILFRQKIVEIRFPYKLDKSNRYKTRNYSNYRNYIFRFSKIQQTY